MRRVSALCPRIARDGEKIGGDVVSICPMICDFDYFDCSIVNLEEIIAVKRGSGWCPCMDRGLNEALCCSCCPKYVDLYFLPTSTRHMCIFY